MDEIMKHPIPFAISVGATDRFISVGLTDYLTQLGQVYHAQRKPVTMTISNFGSAPRTFYVLQARIFGWLKRTQVTLLPGTRITFTCVVELDGGQFQDYRK